MPKVIGTLDKRSFVLHVRSLLCEVDVAEVTPGLIVIVRPTNLEDTPRCLIGADVHSMESLLSASAEVGVRRINLDRGNHSIIGRHLIVTFKQIHIPVVPALGDVEERLAVSHTDKREHAGGGVAPLVPKILIKVINHGQVDKARGNPVEAMPTVLEHPGEYRAGEVRLLDRVQQPLYLWSRY